MLAKATNGDAEYDSVYKEQEYKSDIELDMDVVTVDTNHLNGTTTTSITATKVEEDDGFYYPSATGDAMATYQNISNNIYLGAANGKSIAEESMPCECKFEPGMDDPEAACGDDDLCINRMMFMECMMDDCPCDRYCRNRRFQLRQYARVDVIKTEKKGFGLRALTDLPRNAFIMEYIGEVITNTEFIRRTRAYEMEGLKHYYFMTLKTDEIIDATKKGCLARFINHSCNPNSVTQKWVVGKTMRIGIFTKRPVKAGSELTFDYKFERYGAVAQKCYCGEPNCKGYIGGTNKGTDEEEEEEEEQEVYTPSDISTMNEYSLLNQPSLDRIGDDEMKEAVTLTQKRMLGKLHQRRESEPLHQPDEVKKFVKRMLDSKGKPKLVIRLLRTLELTNSNSSLGKDVLRRFVHLHGLKMLKCWLTEWKSDEEIVQKVLHVLEQLPLANRNGLEDCKLFEVVDKYTTHENEHIKALAISVLDGWKELKSVYRIPKRAYVEPKLEDQQGNTKRRDHPMDEDSSLLPALKRPPYLSSRDYIDPDDDYYEYLTYNADLVEIQQRMEFLPMPAIPTAPRAMLESSLAYGLPPSRYHMTGEYDMNGEDTITSSEQQQPLDSSSHIPPSSVYSEDIPTGPSGSYYDMYAIAAASSTSAVYGTTYGPSQQQGIYDNMGENGDVIEQPYVSNGSISTTTPKLPSNWRQATTEDGSIYYYHKITNKTQWTFPEEKASSIEGVDSARLEDVVNQAIIRKSHSPSVDGSPSSVSHHHQGMSSSASTTPTSRLDAATSSNIILPSSSSSPIQHTTSGISTSRSGSTDTGSTGLDEADLKKEVGKVVIRHLNGTSKNKALWNGDKYLFKELARKLTHHIVERETQSNRKVHAMNSALRGKIEKFIDTHGAAFATKLKSKKELGGGGSIQ
ncbi:uncharacterized protein BX664DRAFT_377482 [Halteromyces radiatus]|uniref:uncharacterized protein n=1 Tax=Halteromyces radiatus TaxID=101107 RepID=UPI00221F5D47|nr:uncharacterized protein BX664DRAFT_377482 [Halteromyces radiatus]KAI8099759.1 hypothetical protein BX664DRAFT_377482 [Halteromyces radiatus]